MSRPLKGQFFLLGAILLCTMFFIGLPHLAIHSAPEDAGLGSLSVNLEREVPHAFNLALAEDQDTGKLGVFLDFARNESAERYASLEALWVASLPDTGNPGDVTVEAGNWLGRPVTISLSVEGNDESFQLDDRETSGASFSGLPQTYELTLEFGERHWSGEVQRDKSSLYSYMSLSRGGSLVVSEGLY